MKKKVTSSYLFLSETYYVCIYDRIKLVGLSIVEYIIDSYIPEINCALSNND